jgi:RNA polymerase sigma factor (sigma-70 family)
MQENGGNPMGWKFRTASDADIVRRVLAGKRDDFSVLVERYLSVVQAVAYARTGNRSDAQDVAQDAFLTAFEKLDTVRDVSSIGAWLTTIARHWALRLVQQRQHRAELQERNLPQEPEAHMPSPEKTEMRELLRQEVLRLDEDFREVLMLHYFAGKKIREVAALLDITVDAAKKRLQRAREALSASLTTQLPELLEADEPREKQVSRIMGVVAMATPSWQGASMAMAGGGAATAMSSALAAKFALTATVFIVSGGLLWNWQRPDSVSGPRSSVASHGTLTSSSEVGEDLKPAAIDSEPTVATERVVEPTRLTIAETVSDAATELTRAILAATSSGLSISGTVVDANGNPVPASEVVVHIDDPYKHETTEADAEGRFFISSLPQTHVAFVHATSPENEPLLFESKIAGPFKLQDSSITGLVITLDLPRNRKLSGTVVDVTGKPIEGVGVLANPQDHRQFGNNVWTDARGQFSIPGLAAGNYRIGLSPPGHHSWAIKGNSPVYTIPTDRDLTGIQITYAEYGSLVIGGRVTNDRGESIVGAHIQWTPGGGDETRTDKDGRYTIYGLPPGDDYVVMVYDPNYTSQQIEHVSPGQTDIDFVLMDRGGVEGTVLDARTGAPIPEFEIGHSGEIPTERGHLYLGDRWESFANADGQFQLSDLNALWTHVKAKAKGYSPNEARVRVDPGAITADLVLRLDPSRTLTGIVTDTASTPIAGALVLMGDRLPQGVDFERAAAARTETNGEFRLDTIPTDVESILVYHPGYTTEEVALTSADMQSVDVRLNEGARLEGTVTMNGEPVGRVSLELRGYSQETGVWSEVASVDLAGHFAFPHVRPGEAILQVRLVSPTGSPTTRLAIRGTYVEDAETVTLDVDFPTYSSSLEGMVTVDGAAVGGAYVSIATGTADHKEILETNSDGNGAYYFEQAPSGHVTLVAEHHDGQQAYAKQTDLVVVPGVVARMDIDFGANHTNDGAPDQP